MLCQSKFLIIPNSQGPETLNWLVSLTSRTLDVINRLFSQVLTQTQQSTHLHISSSWSAALSAEFAAEGRSKGEEYVCRNTDSMFGLTWRSWRISAKLLCPWSTAVPTEDASMALLPEAAEASPPPAAPACCVRRATKRAWCEANCLATPPGVYTAAAHACCCRTACICAAHAMLSVTGALVEGEGPGDGCSRAARDFFGMSCVFGKVVPHPEDFVCSSTGNSSDFPPQPLGILGISWCSWFKQTSWARPKKNLTKILYHIKLLN